MAVAKEDELVCRKEPKTNFTIQWKPEHYPYLYNDRNYAILPDIPKRFESSKTEVSMNSPFFSCFCEKWYNGTRRLILRGNDLQPRIGRRFHDRDVPYLIHFLRSNRDVVCLNLAYNRIHCTGFINLVDYIIEYNHIVELNLQNNIVRKPGMDHLCRVGEKLLLKTLRLNGNKFGVESAKQVALMLLKNSYLKHLDVAEVDQTASSLVYFTTVMRWDQDHHNETLKILDISRPNPGFMHYFDTAHFASTIGAMLRFNRCLVELHVQKYSFSCHDIELMLVDGKYNDTLHLLDLNNNNIGDYGMEQLANWLAERPALRGLLLARNIITDSGARALSFGMPFSKIRMLDLSYNKITDSGASDIFNSMKKSTGMCHLRMFGNCIGHSTAKIVERMLISGVLIQENLDIKPYRIDHRWYFAHYPADHYKQRYYDVPSYASPQPLKVPYIDNIFKGTIIPKVRFEYIDSESVEYRRSRNHPDHSSDCVCYECKENRAKNSFVLSTVETAREVCICGTCRYTRDEKEPSILQSEVISVTNSSSSTSTCHPEDCVCCYCQPYKENGNLPLLEHDKHLIDCTCCKCTTQKVEHVSSSLSTDLNKAHDHPCEVNKLQKILLIVARVNSKLRQNVLRWVNIDEVTLDEDLKAASIEIEKRKREEKCDQEMDSELM